MVSYFTSCLKIDLTSHLLHDVCNVNASSYVRKVVSHEACQKDQNGITAKRTTFWGSAIHSFIHWSRYGLQAQNKKQLAWKGVAKEGNLENDKFHSKPKYYFKALGYLLSRNQTTQSYHGKINSFVEFTLFKNNPFLTLTPKIV